MCKTHSTSIPCFLYSILCSAASIARAIHQPKIKTQISRYLHSRLGAVCATHEIDTPLVLARERKRAVAQSLVSGSVALFHFDMMEVWDERSGVRYNKPLPVRSRFARPRLRTNVELDYEPCDLPLCPPARHVVKLAGSAKGRALGLTLHISFSPVSLPWSCAVFSPCFVLSCLCLTVVSCRV